MWEHHTYTYTFPYSQHLFLSWPFTLVYTVSVSDPAHIPEVHKDFSKERSYSANSCQGLTFSYGPKITRGFFWVKSPITTQIMFGFQVNSRAWLCLKTGAAYPTDLQRQVSRAGDVPALCAMPNANNIQKAILSVLTVLQAVKQWPRCKDSPRTAGKKIALVAHSTS